jgi:hypothetical protein
MVRMARMAGRVPLLAGVVAVAVCVLVGTLGAQVGDTVGDAGDLSDFAIQPAPLVITGTPVDAIAQSYDDPLPGARSPRNANYTLEAALDHATRRLEGRETLRWRNISSRPADDLQFHLYWNAWRNRDSTWMRERALAGGAGEVDEGDWSYVEVESLRVRRVPTAEGVPGAPMPDPDLDVDAPAEPGPWLDLTAEMAFIAPDDGNAADRTVLLAPLAQAVLPGETVEIEIVWTSKVPRTFARTGYQDDYYLIAHWFPKIAVLENAGWNAHQFHSPTEFYADFGVYDVSLTLPEAFVLGATGQRVAETSNGDGTTTYRYQAEDVHEFAWTASPHFVEFTEAFEHPTLPAVEMRLLLLPEHAGQQDRHFAATAATLRLYGEWFGPYPYPNVTVVDPAWQSGSAGMEYPMLFTAGTRWLNPARGVSPESVTLHEMGHQWVYGIVATNEFEDAWMDEGINQYAQARAQMEAFPDRTYTTRYFGGFVPFSFADAPWTRPIENGLFGFFDNAEADVQATPTFRYWPGSSHFDISYSKTALALNTLEAYLGWDVMRTVLQTYFARWQFRHPTPNDFFAIVNEVSGQDLTWFVDQTYRSSNAFDYGLRTLTSAPDTSAGYFDGDDGAVLGDRDADGRFRTVVVAERYGEGIFPVEVATTFDDGETVTELWDGASRRVVYTYERDARAVRAAVDPDYVLKLDVARTNNSLTLEPLGPQVSLKWALKWLVWMQDLLLTWGVFV